MTLMINDDVVRDKIKRGKPITCGADSKAGDMAVTALFRMPSSRYVFLNFPEKEKQKGKEKEEEKKNEDGETTAATDDENASGEITWPPDQEKQPRKWCEAVAGIAFGGLVPQTTASLKDAVEFTALGGLRWDKNKCFKALRKLLWAVHRRAISRKRSRTGSYDSDTVELTEKLLERFHLFGKYKMRGISNIDHETSIFDPYLGFPANGLDTRTAARVFSCYMTLLECAAAQYFHAEKSKSTKPVESKDSLKQPETTPNLLVEKIFKACSTELEDAYQDAVNSMRPQEILDRKRSTTSEAEPSSSRNTDAQMVENEQGETEVHVEPSSTSNNEGFEGVNEGDETIGSQKESPQGSNDPNPAIEGKYPERKSSESHQDSKREILIRLQVMQPPTIFSRKIKDLVKDIGGVEFDGGDSDDDESDDNEDNIYYDSDGNEYGATTPKDNNTVEEKSPFTAKVCGQIAHVLIAAWAQQVQIIEWNSNKVCDDRHMPSPDSFPDISALGGI
ncbi:hypothetical protein NA56DRAFT_641445 [Hyaloscypha hepaticicola]|uniref:Uncharacterized protein n=1 Tax=Hyaloscypha hepaticicola TaxID=2082293 RepID=A0A2J6QKJ3_9HELO|nr:hypothetical protein NA56DRAFT_641445 [Hyaloscypha hepaticicola]